MEGLVGSYEGLIRTLLTSNSNWVNENGLIAVFWLWTLFVYYANLWSWLDVILIIFVGGTHLLQASTVSDNSFISDIRTGRPLYDTQERVAASPVVFIAVCFFLQYVTYLRDIKPRTGAKTMPAGLRLRQVPTPSWSASSWLFLPWDSSLFSRRISADRPATYAEAYLAQAFREYLAFTVHKSRKPLQSDIPRLVPGLMRRRRLNHKLLLTWGCRHCLLKQTRSNQQQRLHHPAKGTCWSLEC